MTRAIKALLVGGTAFPFHDLEELGPTITAALAEERVDVDLTTDRDALETLPEECDVVIDYTTDSQPTEAQLSGLRGFVADGGGYAGVHGAAALTSTVPDDPAAVIGERDEPIPEYRDLIGGRFLDHPAPQAFAVRIVDSHHPVSHRLSDFRVYDEPYRVATDDVRVLARMDHPDLGDQPVAWVQSFGDGRSFYTALGHSHSAFADGPLALLGAGVRWAGRA